MAAKKRVPRRFVATDAQRSRLIDRLLTHEDPVVRRATMIEGEQLMAADLAKWSQTDLRKQVLWSVKFAAEHMGKRQGDAHEEAWATRVGDEIMSLLRDPRAQGMGKPEGLTEALVRAAIVAWAERPGRRLREPKAKKQRQGSGTRTDNTRRKEKAALALLRAIGLASNVTIEAVTKLIDRHVGRAADPGINAALDD